MTLRLCLLSILITSSTLFGGEDYHVALKRAQYLFTGTFPTNSELSKHGSSVDSVRTRLRHFIEDDERFYTALLRFHETAFGTGLEVNYIDELLRNDIDSHENKFARINCSRTSGANGRLRCIWSSATEGDSNSGQCSTSQEQAVSVFWYPKLVAWACPSVIRACGYDLSNCFIEYADPDEARHSELGTTEAFDSRHSVIKSLSKQAAGIATRLAYENYPYRLLLKSGLTAVDGAVAHFYKQTHHFKIDELQIPNEVVDIVKGVSFVDSKFTLVNVDESYESGGIISTFGWLRRYDKNRTRGNELYKRLLCRKFTSELPRVFPQDPGNLRKTPGCSGCHASLDPLADFFRTWGEGGEIYEGSNSATSTSFAGKTGKYVSDLASIIAGDNAFATCTTMHVWEWLMGRQFYFDEAELRAALTTYFISTDYSLRELIYAVSSHPAFMEAGRGDGVVTDPLSDPPLGEVPENIERPCTDEIDYATDIEPDIDMCTSCHSAGSDDRVDLTTEDQWQAWGSQSVGLMSSGQMPPGQMGSAVTDLKEKVRCWLEQ